LGRKGRLYFFLRRDWRRGHGRQRSFDCIVGVFIVYLPTIARRANRKQRKKEICTNNQQKSAAETS
jgi:hypothetical protein